MEESLVWEFLGFFLGLSLLTYALRWTVRSWSGAATRGQQQEQQQRLAAVDEALLVASISFLWYAISLSFTLYNKWLLQQWHGGFDYPVLITSVHMTLKWIVAQLWKTITQQQVATLPLFTELAIVLPIGAFTAADIVCSNFAVYYLPLSMYTTIKGSTLMFTFFWAVVCRVQHFSYPLFGAVAAICAGLMLAIGSSAMVLSPLGIFFAFGSAAAGGLRWVLVQVLAVRDEQSKGVMLSLYRFSPYGALSIIPFAFIIDAPAVARSEFAQSPLLLSTALLYSLLGGFFAFALIVVEVRLLMETSSLTMSVIGQIKEIVQIGAAMLLFGDNISWKSAVGIALSIAASCYYRQLAVQYAAKENAAAMAATTAADQLIKAQQHVATAAVASKSKRGDSGELRREQRSESSSSLLAGDVEINEDSDSEANFTAENSMSHNSSGNSSRSGSGSKIESVADDERTLLQRLRGYFFGSSQQLSTALEYRQVTSPMTDYIDDDDGDGDYEEGDGASSQFNSSSSNSGSSNSSCNINGKVSKSSPATTAAVSCGKMAQELRVIKNNTAAAAVAIAAPAAIVSTSEKTSSSSNHNSINSNSNKGGSRNNTSCNSNFTSNSSNSNSSVQTTSASVDAYHRAAASSGGVYGTLLKPTPATTTNATTTNATATAAIHSPVFAAPSATVISSVPSVSSPSPHCLNK